eukprot:SAG11_NODE_48_length_20030_cov_232.459084_10_plen_150_part_00
MSDDTPRKLGAEDFDAQQWATTLQAVLKQAEEGSANEQVLVGFALGRGHAGREPNWIEAVKWYTLAARQGHAGAMHVLGVSYAKGRGVGQDWSAAFRWFKSAADGGDANGMFQTAWCYFNAKGTEKHLGQAATWCNEGSRFVSLEGVRC